MKMGSKRDLISRYGEDSRLVLEPKKHAEGAWPHLPWLCLTTCNAVLGRNCSDRFADRSPRSWHRCTKRSQRSPSRAHRRVPMGEWAPEKALASWGESVEESVREWVLASLVGELETAWVELGPQIVAP